MEVWTNATHIHVPNVWKLSRAMLRRGCKAARHLHYDCRLYKREDCFAFSTPNRPHKRHHSNEKRLESEQQDVAVSIPQLPHFPRQLRDADWKFNKTISRRPNGAARSKPVSSDKFFVLHDLAVLWGGKHGGQKKENTPRPENRQMFPGPFGRPG